MRGTRLNFSVCIALILGGLAGCESSSSGGGGTKGTGNGPCQEPAQCSEGVCLDVNGESYCTRECGNCPSGMICDSTLFGPLGISVCVKGAQDNPSAPPKPTEPPRAPCSTDADCQAVDSKLVCATYGGEKDCTRTCTETSQCHFSTSQMGMNISMRFLSCQPDQGNKGRNVCLPDPSCQGQAFQNCITFEIGGLPQEDAHGDDVIVGAPDATASEVQPDTGAVDTAPAKDTAPEHGGSYVPPACEDDLDCGQAPDAYCDKITKTCQVPCKNDEDCEDWLPGKGTHCVLGTCH